MEFSLPMALFDFIPVFLFGWSTIIFQRYFYKRMSRGPFALYCSGTIMVVAAGIFKAAWKLLIALGICDFQALNSAFMPMQSLGFLLSAVAVLRFVWSRKSEGEVLLSLPVISSSMPFVVLLVLGSLGAYSGYMILALRRKKKGISLMFLLSFLLLLGMGYLSSRDFSKASINWIGEFVNLFAQGSLLIGAYGLTR